MKIKKQHMLLMMLVWIASLFVQADTEIKVDYEAARSLRSRLSGTVGNETLSPVWNPDGSALFYLSENTVWEIDTAAGEKKEAIQPESLTRFFDGHMPSITRFAVTETGTVICMARYEGQIKTINVSNGSLVKVEDNPFGIPPSRLTENTASTNRRGKTRIFFVNDSEETTDIEWITHAGTRRHYATLQPGQIHEQSTTVGHVFTGGGKAFTAQEKPGIAFMSSEPPGAEIAETSPKEDAAEPTRRKEEQLPWKAEVREHNLFLTNRKTGREIPLTTDGTDEAYYAEPFRWSPDGRYLVAPRIEVGSRRTIDLIKAAPSDRLQPETLTIPYLKPGDEIDIIKPRLFDAQTGKAIALDDTLYPNPFHYPPYYRRFHWAKESGRFFFIYNERGHQTLRLIAVQASTGKTAVLVEETSPTFIDYSQKTYVHHLDHSDEAIWMSERSGWNHLYLVNRRNGETKPITKGDWVVRSVEHVDEENRKILFRLAGYYPEQDPCYFHYATINFDGTGLTLLTEENGTHEIKFSPDRKFFTDTWSRPDRPPVHELRRSSDGKKISDLGEADAAKLLEIHPHLPEPFIAKGRDGETDISGVIYRPSHFDPAKKYPVIESIYSGPHDFFSQKSFRPYSSQQELAELGFIVVQIDGMGTNWRSKAFHDVCWKNLKDAGFPDRIAWMKAAAEKYPCMDLTRVGIYGGSAGGQDAMRALLDHSGFYKAAVADCGCHDNRMDKIWWNEAWMGWPVDDSYIESSNLEDAHRLEGKLLLAVGMLDSNVDPSSTLQVADALIKAGKDFELHVEPDGGHCVMSSGYGRDKLMKFFVHHLLGEEIGQRDSANNS